MGPVRTAHRNFRAAVRCSGSTSARPSSSTHEAIASPAGSMAARCSRRSRSVPSSSASRSCAFWAAAFASSYCAFTSPSSTSSSATSALVTAFASRSCTRASSGSLAISASRSAARAATPSSLESESRWARRTSALNVSCIAVATARWRSWAGTPVVFEQMARPRSYRAEQTYTSRALRPRRRACSGEPQTPQLTTDDSR
jgi:hypothetical protein